MITIEELNKKAEKYVPKNPRIEDRRYYFLNDEEIKRMKDATALFSPEQRDTYHAMLCLMLNSGLRRENVRNLRIEQIDWENRVIRLREAEIKTRVSTIVPFNDETARSLRAVIGGRTSGNVFLHKTQGKDSRMTYSKPQINNIIGSVGRKAGIQPKEKFHNVNPHLLRHTWAKKCKEAGVPKEIVRAWGGWTSNKMLDEIYGQPSIETLTTVFREKVVW